MCHVLSEGSKWSSWVRPCGLSPCAPRYYYSTPRCPIVYGLVLSSACCVLCLRCSCAPVLWCVPCALPALPVVWLRGAVAVVCGCVLTLLSPPLWVCATVCPVLPVSCLPYFLGIIPALYMGGAICGPCTLPIYVPYFFRLAIYDPFCTHSKSRPLDSECGFPKVGLNFRCSVFLFAEFSPVKFPA